MKISTCNEIHSLGWDQALGFLGVGWYRTAWKINTGPFSETSVVIKTQRQRRNTTKKLLESYQVEAQIMSAISNEFSLNIYGNCGNTNIVELGGQTTLDWDIQNLVRQSSFGQLTANPLDLLETSLGLVKAIAHSHANINKFGKLFATTAHLDLKPEQFVQSIRQEDEGKKKYLLNDFNWARFLSYRKEGNALRLCSVLDNNNHVGFFRSPEELAAQRSQTLKPFSDRADVYALGGLINFLGTGFFPFEREIAETGRNTSAFWLFRYPGRKLDEEERKVEKAILSGKDMDMSAWEAQRGDSKSLLGAKKILSDAIKKCRKYDPKDRPSTIELLTYLKHQVRQIALN